MKELSEKFPPRLSNMIGRRRKDFNFRIGKENAVYVRFEDRSSPYVIDLFRRNSKVDFFDVPEAKALFHDRFTEDETLWKTHLHSLIGFFYEPNLVVQLAHDLFGILVDDHLYFVDGNLTFGDISNLLVKDIFKEREITDVRGKPFETITSRTKIID